MDAQSFELAGVAKLKVLQAELKQQYAMVPEYQRQQVRLADLAFKRTSNLRSAFKGHVIQHVISPEPSFTAIERVFLKL